MRSLKSMHIRAVALVTSTLAATAGAQIRTPIATVPLTTSTQGPAPTNAKAVATSPTSVAVSWDAAAGVRSYLVERRQADNPTCCVSQSGLITTSSWQDVSLTAGAEYSFVVTAVYSDGSYAVLCHGVLEHRRCGGVRRAASHTVRAAGFRGAGSGTHSGASIHTRRRGVVLECAEPTWYELRDRARELWHNLLGTRRFNLWWSITRLSWRPRRDG